MHNERQMSATQRTNSHTWALTENNTIILKQKNLRGAAITQRTKIGESTKTAFPENQYAQVH
jgi:hypothetical protein